MDRSFLKTNFQTAHVRRQKARKDQSLEWKQGCKVRLTETVLRRRLRGSTRSAASVLPAFAPRRRVMAAAPHADSNMTPSPATKDKRSDALTRCHMRGRPANGHVWNHVPGRMQT